MKTGRLWIMFAACTLCSCEKPAVDYRDKFEGVYQGDLHTSWYYTMIDNPGDTCFYNQSAYAIKAADSNHMYINFPRMRYGTKWMYLDENGNFKYREGGQTFIDGRFTSDSLIFRIQTGGQGMAVFYNMTARKVSGTIPDTIRQSIIDNGQTVW